MHAFDTAPTKTKKQLKKEQAAFPSLAEESKDDKPFSSLAALDSEPVAKP